MSGIQGSNPFDRLGAQQRLQQSRRPNQQQQEGAASSATGSQGAQRLQFAGLQGIQQAGQVAGMDATRSNTQVAGIQGNPTQPTPNVMGGVGRRFVASA